MANSQEKVDPKRDSMSELKNASKRGASNSRSKSAYKGNQARKSIAEKFGYQAADVDVLSQELNVDT